MRAKRGGRERGRRGDNNPLKGMGEGREGEYRKGGNYLGFLEDRRITSTTGRRTEGGGAGARKKEMGKWEMRDG